MIKFNKGDLVRIKAVFLPEEKILIGKEVKVLYTDKDGDVWLDIAFEDKTKMCAQFAQIAIKNLRIMNCM